MIYPIGDSGVFDALCPQPLEYLRISEILSQNAQMILRRLFSGDFSETFDWSEISYKINIYSQIAKKKWSLGVVVAILKTVLY